MDEVWWGYRPHWAKEKAPEPINATVEKVATSNYSRGAFAHYCCLMSEVGMSGCLWMAGSSRIFCAARTANAYVDSVEMMLHGPQAMGLLFEIFAHSRFQLIFVLKEVADGVYLDAAFLFVGEKAYPLD